MQYVQLENFSGNQTRSLSAPTPYTLTYIRTCIIYQLTDAH